MQKFNLNQERYTMKEMVLSPEQFNIPNEFYIQASPDKIKIHNKYEKINGENVKTDEIAKITLSAYDFELVKFLKKGNQPLDQLRPIEIEFEQNFEKLQKLMQQGQDGFDIKLDNPEVKLKYQQKGKAGGWNSVRLTANDFEIVNDEK